MNNNKLLISVFGAVLILAGLAMTYLTNPDLFDFGGEPATELTPEPGDDAPDKPDEEEEIDPRDLEDPDVAALNDRITTFSQAPWSKSDYEALKLDIKIAGDNGNIDPAIAKKLDNKLFNYYLVTVKNTALKVIRSSTDLNDLWPPHEELKRLKPLVSGPEVTEVTNMTHAIYSLRKQIKGIGDLLEASLTDQTIKSNMLELGRKIDNFSDRFAEFKTSRLVGVLCKQYMKTLQDEWGKAVIARVGSKITDFTDKESYNEPISTGYLQEMEAYRSTKYLNKNNTLVSWATEQETILKGHATAEKMFLRFETKGGGDCERIKRFDYYYSRCMSLTEKSSATSQ